MKYNMHGIDKRLATIIDHTLLKPEAGERDILTHCEEALVYGFASVCVQPSWVRLCSSMLRSSPVAVCTVIGFPLGVNRTDTKVKETEFAAADGADEFDVVLHQGRLKDLDHAYVEHDLAMVVRAAHAGTESALVKVILETASLTDEQIADACRIAIDAGADFVKTSTGYGPGGATVIAVRLMRQCVGPRIGVKASGGIRTCRDALSMVEAGADRIGSSSAIAIVTQ